MAGYGIITGFEDAVNLAWKLAATLQGWAGRACWIATALSASLSSLDGRRFH